MVHPLLNLAFGAFILRVQVVMVGRFGRGQHEGYICMGIPWYITVVLMVRRVFNGPLEQGYRSLMFLDFYLDLIAKLLRVSGFF